MTKFDRVLSGDDIRVLIDWISEKPRHTGKMLRHVEKTILNKLAEQEPVAWTSAEIMSGPSFVDDDDYAIMYKTKSHLLDDFCGYPEATPVPLYIHPMPSVSQTISKTGCVSESAESDTQHHIEYIKRYQNWRRGEDKTMGEAGITPKQLGESLDWLIAFAENHIVDNNKMVGNTQKTTLKQGK